MPIINVNIRHIPHESHVFENPKDGRYYNTQPKNLGDDVESFKAQHSVKAVPSINFQSKKSSFYQFFYSTQLSTGD